MKKKMSKEGSDLKEKMKQKLKKKMSKKVSKLPEPEPLNPFADLMGGPPGMKKEDVKALVEK